MNDPETGRFVEGNPGGGRPKGSLSITAEIKKKLQEVPEGKEKTYLQYLIDQILKKAVIEADQQTIKQIWNYIDGMPDQGLIHKGNIVLNIEKDIAEQNGINISTNSDSEGQTQV
ncbi:MAG: hypothetical protein H7831_15810 [Magnetococcus sp. WYHC-3]